MKLLMHSLQLAITVLLAVCLSSQVQGEETKPPSNVREALRLEDLERMALEKNPTLAQAGALVREAEGRKTQAGLYPNPTFGYSGEEITVRHPSDKSQHSLFIEQKIITGGKLQRSREIFAREQAKAEADLQAQRQRVLNMVRIIFFKVMGAQRLVELRGELARIAREAVGITEELFNIGQADQPDILEAEIEAQRAELDLINAENELQRVWQMLAGVVGEPALPKMGLLGDLEIEIPKLDQETIFTRILEESPEIQSARASGERAKAALERAKVQPIPDVSLRGGVGYDVERLHDGRRAGPSGFIEIGIPIPLFDRNQGNIAAAIAELKFSEHEVRRLQLALKVRLASVFKTYLSALQAVGRYQKKILPQAQKAYDLYLKSFQQMAAAYPQVLIAQRTLFQVRADYVHALVTVRQNVVEIEGLLLTDGLNEKSDLSVKEEIQSTKR